MAIIEKLDSDLTTGLLSTAQTLSDGAMSFAGPLFRTMVVIYFAVWGYILWTGSVQEPLRDTILRFLRVTVVATVALGAGIYSTYIIGFAFNGPSEIVNGIVGTEYDAVEQLDGIWTEIREKGKEAADKETGTFGFSQALENMAIAALLWLAAFVLVVPPFFVILLSKVILAVLLAVGPIFIALALFQRGVQFTQSWATQLITYVFIYVLLMILMHIAADTVITLIENGMEGRRPSFGIALEVVLISMVMLFSVTLIPTIGGGLAGGFAAPVQGILSKIPGPGTATRMMSQRRSIGRQKQMIRATAGRDPDGLGTRAAKSTMSGAASASRSAGQSGKSAARKVASVLSNQ